MRAIHRLDPVVANQIAAGEVVERPASAVKELIENSLDAQASQILVRVEDGGRTLIDIRDDGMGIAEEDVALAVERHTTSKLTRLEDLETQSTLGFRGEALAAIASVSELRISSRTGLSAVGYQVQVDYGMVSPVTAVAMGRGTRVQVRHLFSQHPARAKALRSASAEFGQIQHIVQQLAIGRPDVQFELTTAERTVCQTPGQNDALAALLAVFGRDLANDVIRVQYTSERGWKISGFIAPAHRHRANRFGQALYINGRWITNYGLRAVVEEAFRPQLPHRRFPYFWLWIELPPVEVDPNAHPSKAEVRIYEEHVLKAMLYRQVHDALVRSSSSIAMGVPDERLSQGTDSEIGPSSREALQGTLFDEVSSASEGSGAGEVLHQEFRDLTPLAQWHAKYIVAQGPKGLYLVDQHAAHERIYYERFRRHGAQPTLAQSLLIPISETLSGQEWSVLQHHGDDLLRMGFQIDTLGGRTVVIRAVPTAFHDLDSHQGLFRTVIELMSGDLAFGQHPVSWAEDAFYAMAACKAAIKANRPLSQLEMVQLLEEMSRVNDPRGCPHGRPTLILLTLEEVDRRFGRRA